MAQLQTQSQIGCKGFLQRACVYYLEVYAPVVGIETIRLVVSMASAKGLPLLQLDEKSAFLNGPIEEEVYVSQPPVFEIKGEKNKVFKLSNALYG